MLKLDLLVVHIFLYAKPAQNKKFTSYKHKADNTVTVSLRKVQTIHRL